MKKFNQIIIAILLAFSLQHTSVFSAAFEEGLSEDFASTVGKQIDESIDESATKLGTEFTEEQTTAIKSAIQDALKDIDATFDKVTIKAIVKETTESVTESIVKALGRDFKPSEFTGFVEKDISEATENAALKAAEENLSGEDLTTFESDLKEAGESSLNSFHSSKEKPENNLTEVQTKQVKAADEAAAEEGAGATKGARSAEDITQSIEAVRTTAGKVVLGEIRELRLRIAGKWIKPYEEQISKIEGQMNSKAAESATREIFVAEKGAVTDEGLVASKSNSFKAAEGKNQTVLSTKYNRATDSFDVTDELGNKMSIPRRGILKHTDTDNVAFSLDKDGQVVWKFNKDDDSLFSSDGNFKKGNADQPTKSFEDLSNEKSLTSQYEDIAKLKGDLASKKGFWGRVGSYSKTTVKGICNKIYSMLVTAIHGLGQALIFTVPNMLEQDRVQAAQLQEQWMALTSAQSFGNLRVQIPAFLIPKGSPTTGIFLYRQVPQDTPANKPNNFTASELLNGVYYVSIADAYSAWGSSYIPQTGKLICLNNGFVFDAGGNAISMGTMFMPLLLDPGASPTSSAGANPVAPFLQSLLGKGIAGKTSSSAHVSSWRDWLPFGKVDTVNANPGDNPNLKFLLSSSSVQQIMLPAPLFSGALTQFFKPTTVGTVVCEIAASASSSDKTKQKANYVACMHQGFNSVQVSQMKGLGNATALLKTNVTPDASLVTNVQNLVNAQQDLINAIITSPTSDADRTSKLNPIINNLTIANSALIDQNTNALGLAPTVFPNALGIYVYETTQTPIAQFMAKHSPAAVQPLVKDYVVFLGTSNPSQPTDILPLMIAQINQQGQVEYLQNQSIQYMCSLVSGRTYAIGNGASIAPFIPTDGTVTTIANAAWTQLSSGLSTNHATLSTAITSQITAMADYAMTLIADGPYYNNGYTFTKVPLALNKEDEKVSIQNTFASLANQNGVTLTQADQTVLKNIPAITMLSYPIRQKFISSDNDATGVLIYKVAGALGTLSDGTPIDDYIIGVGETTITTSNGTQSGYIILPLSTLAFPNEPNQGTGIVAIVSLITGRVFTPDYLPVSPAWVTTVARTTSSGQMQGAIGSSNLQVNGTAVASVTAPMATVYMPTDYNPYNYVPTNPADYSTQQNLQSNLVTAVQNKDNVSIKSLIAQLAAFNTKIANGSIPIVKRGSTLLYMPPLYWAFYPGYSVYNASNTTTQASATGPAALWIYNSVSTTIPQSTISSTSGSGSNSTTTLAPLVSTLPVTTLTTLGLTYNNWTKFMGATNLGTQAFEEGPFNLTQNTSNTLYLTLSMANAKTSNFFYQVVPNFSASDLLIVGDMKPSVLSASTAASTAKGAAAGSTAVQATFTVDDFVNIGGSYTSAANPVVIDLKNGYVFIPNPKSSNSCPINPLLCNFCYLPDGSMPIITNVTEFIDAALANQSTSMSQLQTSNPLLAHKLQMLIYKFNTNFQQLLTQNFFAGKQLLLNPDAISSYIYAVAQAPNTNDYATGSSDYATAVKNAWESASDYWVCFTPNSTTFASIPLTASTQSMVSLITKNSYIPTSASSQGPLSASTQSMLQDLTDVPSSFVSNIENLSDLYATQQGKEVVDSAQTMDSYAQPASFFAGLTQVAHMQFDNLYTDGKQYFLKIIPPITITGSVDPSNSQASTLTVTANTQTNSTTGVTSLTPTATQNTTYFAFNEINATEDMGLGYYYPALADAQNNYTLGSVLGGFNLQAMRAHYGVNVNGDGSQTLVLPIAALPLPMQVVDKKLDPTDPTKQDGVYMQYLGSITPTPGAPETDYYYQNTFANNFLMRRVSKNPLSQFGLNLTNAASGSKQAAISTDYYVDLLSGDEYQTNGSPRLEQVNVGYPTDYGDDNNTVYNMTNPLFVWSEIDINTNLPTYYTLFQDANMNPGYTLLTPQAYGVSYDVQANSSSSSNTSLVITRYGYQVASDSTVSITSTPIANSLSGVAAQLGTPTIVGTDMQTVLSTALQTGTLVSINTLCVDGSEVSQIPTVPSVYTVLPSFDSEPSTFTQVIPDVTTSGVSKKATASTKNNVAFISVEQVQAFLKAKPFVATIAGTVATTSGPIALSAPQPATSPDYYVCGLMSEDAGLLGLITSYPDTGNPQLPAGRYYFVANATDSSSKSNVWLQAVANNAYTLTLLAPQLDSTASNLSPNPDTPGINAGIFDYTATIASTAAPTVPASTAGSTQSPTTSVLAPTDWTKGAYYVTAAPQTFNTEADKYTSLGSTNVFNFKYSSVNPDLLDTISNNVQVVTTLQGQSLLVAPITKADLQGAVLATASDDSATDMVQAPTSSTPPLPPVFGSLNPTYAANVYFYPGDKQRGGPVGPCTLYCVQGNEQITEQVTVKGQVQTKVLETAPFNNQMPTTAGSTASVATFAPVGSYIDIATGVIYNTVSGSTTIYPLPYTAPQGTVEFLKAYLGQSGVNDKGHVIGSYPASE